MRILREGSWSFSLILNSKLSKINKGVNNEAFLVLLLEGSMQFLIIFFVKNLIDSRRKSMEILREHSFKILIDFCINSSVDP